jgi:endonuclease/exonuclease/phosphatase family metal-dependent hydrolase
VKTLRHASLACILGLIIAASAAECTRSARYIRVLSFNIRHGEGMDGQVDLARIAAVIRSARPDLVSLQEVDVGTERTNRIDQVATLARLTGMAPIFVGNITYQGGDYGNAILSRLPITSYQNHMLPNYHGEERRGALEVTVSPENGSTFTFVATHMDYQYLETQMAEAREVNRLFGNGQQTPTVVAGDLNALPQSEVVRIFGEVWSNTVIGPPLPTFPADQPVRQIDYIFVLPARRWRVVDAQVIAEPLASDHRPILVVLELLPP